MFKKLNHTLLLLMTGCAAPYIIRFLQTLMLKGDDLNTKLVTE